VRSFDRETTAQLADLVAAPNKSATVPVEMPFTGEVLGYLPTADEHDVELTVTRANSANPLGAGVVP
jgi:acyl-CoA reductase-like NAD-dependent aldehyde dehydrogenase